MIIGLRDDADGGAQGGEWGSQLDLDDNIIKYIGATA